MLIWKLIPGPGVFADEDHGIRVIYGIVECKEDWVTLGDQVTYVYMLMISLYKVIGVGLSRISCSRPICGQLMARCDL